MPELPDVPNFELDELIGQGAFGRVFLGHPKGQPNVRRAIKLIDPSAFSDPEEARKRFVLEVGALNTLAHVAIVEFRGHGFLKDEDRTPYLVMDYVEGKTLDAAGPDMTPTQRVGAVIEILSAVQHAHDRKILHRDLKPSNAIVSSTGQTYVLDFGMACFLEVSTDERLTQYCAGTAGYIPPEIDADPKLRTRLQDVFACGVILYELLAGRRPNIQDIAPLREVSDDLSGLDAIIRRALDVSSRRYQSAGEFAEALAAWVKQQEARAALQPSPLAERFEQELRKREQEHKELQAQEQRRQQHLDQGHTDAAVEVRAAAEAALTTIWSLLPSGVYELVTDANVDLGPGVRVLGGIRHQEHQWTTWISEVEKLATSFSREKDNFLGFPRNPSPARRAQPRSQPSVVQPVWAVHQTSKDKRGLGSLQGGIALAVQNRAAFHRTTEPELKMYGRDVRMAGHREPSELQGVSEIRDYFLRAVAKTFGIPL